MNSPLRSPTAALWLSSSPQLHFTQNVFHFSVAILHSNVFFFSVALFCSEHSSFLRSLTSLRMFFTPFHHVALTSHLFSYLRLTFSMMHLHPTVSPPVSHFPCSGYSFLLRAPTLLSVLLTKRNNTKFICARIIKNREILPPLVRL